MICRRGPAICRASSAPDGPFVRPAQKAWERPEGIAARPLPAVRQDQGMNWRFTSTLPPMPATEHLLENCQ